MKKLLYSVFVLATFLGSHQAVSAGVFLSAYDRIMAAVDTRDEKALRRLISEGVNINALDSSGQTALCTVLRRQDKTGYQMLFSQGATVHTPCIRQISPQTLASFYHMNPSFGRYVNGRIMVPSAISEERRSSRSILAGIPLPNWGEFLLAGTAVGIVALIGAGGGKSGGGDVPSLYKPVDTGLSLDDFPTLPGGYWTDTSKTFSSASEFSAYATAYKTNLKENNEAWYNAQSQPNAWEYNGWGGWNSYRYSLDGSSVTAAYHLENPVRVLPMVNAASAWIRGYTGYVIDRSDASNPKITDQKVKVAVMDTGLEVDSYAHGQLKANISKTRLNYSYGPCSANNSKKCWAFNSSDGYAYLTSGTAQIITSVPESYEDKYNIRYWDENWGVDTTTPESTQLRKLWNGYASAFAPLCSDKITDNCLQKDGSILTYISGTSGIIFSVPNEKLWTEYTSKYGLTGYVYDKEDPTPALLESSDLWDGDGHGTHVAGSIAAIQDGETVAGVAPNAEIIPVRVDFTTGQVMNHLKEVVEKTDAQVVNLSLGNEIYLSSSAEKNNILWNSLSDDIKAGYEAAAKKGTVLVFAAGNEGKMQPHQLTVAPLVGESDDLKTNYANSIYKNLLISVIAVDENKKIAYFGTEGGIKYESNRCGASSMYCLAAPGGSDTAGVGSTYLGDDYALSMGTSMATPVVSGAVAVLSGAFPFLKPQQVVQILFETADYIKPTDAEIQAYNEASLAAGDSATAYEDNTMEGRYNAIYGHGLLNLAAATDPIGVPKIKLDTVASSALGVDVSKTNVTVPTSLVHTLSVLPKNIVALDKYTRPYAVSTARLVNKEKRSDALKRSFQSFMAQDEKTVAANDRLSFGFTSAPSDSVGLPAGSMTMQMKPSQDMAIRMGYSQDTKSFGGTYAERIIQNPFMNMRQAWGTDVSLRVARHWSLTGGFQYGQNGFIDSKTLDKMSDKPMMKVLQTGVRYAPKKSLVFDVSFGQMQEDESLLGLRGEGAFETDGNKTKFVSFGTTIMPFDKWQLSASYTYGVTEANDTQTLMKFSRLTSDAFALTALYRPDEQSTYGFKVASPLRVRSGTVTFDLPTARDMYADKIYRTQFTSAMKPEAREYDLSMFFMNQLQTNLSLAGEAGVRLHPDHQKEADPDWRGLVHLKYKY